MFTGIVEEVGVVKEIKKIDGGMELSIESTFGNEVHVDESISVNGVCLTVVSFDDKHFKVQCVEETLRKTNLGRLDVGSKVNLERSLTLEKAIEGHIVQGHVDTTGKITRIDKEGADLMVWVECPKEYQNYIVGRGSVALDGISLTVARDEENQFAVAIIPYTWDFTNLNDKKVGDLLNIEFDIFGKYIVKYLEKRGV
tara:strand:+ start:3281 stop:3874 length:594 start_codon:yes stop_codon:yes gene_type:complete